MAALIMPFLSFEMPTTLFVDRARDRIGKMTIGAGRIVRSGDAQRLDLDHPARAEAGEDRIDLSGDVVALGVGGALQSPDRRNTSRP